MKKNVLLLAFLVGFFMICKAQNPFEVMTNNEDEVVQIEQWQQSSAQSLQAIVKLQDYSTYTILEKNENAIAKGRVSCPAIQAILDSFIVESIEQLCPTFVMPKEPRRSPSYGGGEVRDHDLSQIYLITLSPESPKHEFELIEALSALDEVDYAEPNYHVFSLGGIENRGLKIEIEADATRVSPSSQFSTLDSQSESGSAAPNDPMYSMQWGIPACGIDSLLTAPKLDTTWRPIIAIIDTGVDIDHSDLEDNIWTNTAEQNGAAGHDDDNNGFADDIHGWDFVNQTAEMHDFNSHGTHCAGIAGAVSNNGIGIAGACPDALIMPVAVMQSDGTGNVATIIQGINYARQNGADIISMSIGTYAWSIALEQALAVAYQSAVLVASAGNDGSAIKQKCSPPGDPMFPGAFTYVFGVQATCQGGGLAGFSNFDCDGPSYSDYSEEQLYNYELSAPGVGIVSTVPNGGYRSYNGTSMATPLVAGGIASLLQRREYLTKEILFGDLINYSQEFHPVDFWAAYNADSVAPAILQMVTFEVNDTAYGDSSYYADAGERVQIYPTMRTVWGPTDSIEMWLEFQEFEDTSILQILQNHVQLGHPLSAYAKAKSINPIDIQIAKNVVDGRHICLTLCASAPNATDTIRQNFVLSVTNGIKLHGVIMHNDTLWPNAQYLVTSNTVYPTGDTLFIMPGTTLKIDAGCRIEATIIAIGTPDSMITFTKRDLDYTGGTVYSPYGRGEYCIFEYVGASIQSSNSVFRYNNGSGSGTFNNYFMNNLGRIFFSTMPYDYLANRGGSYCNVINNLIGALYDTGNGGISSTTGRNNNIFNNSEYNIFTRCSRFSIFTPDTNYYGSSNESLIREHVYDFYTPNSQSFAYIDFSKKALRPSPLAHGIVWKVEVNGYDAQDEFDSIIPLGVGTHEFKVYFNRAMDTSIAPMLAMGVRPPYTQTAIAENTSWSVDSTIYTAYLTLTGRSAIDGLNRIYVNGAKDNEHFEIPYENQRFNVYVASSGSMSAGFQATPGIGKVDLEWNDQEVNYDDFLGFNMYRYQYVQQLQNYHYDNDREQYIYDTVIAPGDTIRLNNVLIQDTTYTDYDIIPGERYYYFYKILSTALTENSPSKTVSCVPHSTIPGDANGSYAVDIADVITTANYIMGQTPQPFLFEAADVNGDGVINVLDIVSIVNIILYPNGRPGTQSIHEQLTAIYTIENDTLYIDTPVPLSGLQFTISNCTRSDVEVLSALSGFECASVENCGDLTMLFYSMSGITVPLGKTALLRIVDKEVSAVVLSDPQGNNIIAMNGDLLGLVDLNTVQAQFTTAYPNPFSGITHLEITVVNYNSISVVFTDIMGKTVNSCSLTTPTAGKYILKWDATGLPRGIYFATLYADGQKAQTIKLIVK